MTSGAERLTGAQPVGLGSPGPMRLGGRKAARVLSDDKRQGLTHAHPRGSQSPKPNRKAVMETPPGAVLGTSSARGPTLQLGLPTVTALSVTLSFPIPPPAVTRCSSQEDEDCVDSYENVCLHALPCPGKFRNFGSVR
jgi:hypothetical protein